MGYQVRTLFISPKFERCYESTFNSLYLLMSFIKAKGITSAFPITISLNLGEKIDPGCTGESWF